MMTDNSPVRIARQEGRRIIRSGLGASPAKRSSAGKETDSDKIWLGKSAVMRISALTADCRRMPGTRGAFVVRRQSPRGWHVSDESRFRYLRY